MDAMDCLSHIFFGEKTGKHGLGLFFYAKIMYNIKLIALGKETGVFGLFRVIKGRIML